MKRREDGSLNPKLLQKNHIRLEVAIHRVELV
jgi:hypothetical protein